MPEQENILGVIKPNIRKAFLSDFIKIFCLAAIFVGIIVFLDKMINIKETIDTVSRALAFLSPVSLPPLYVWVIGIAVIVTSIILLLDYFNLAKVQYIFYEGKVSVIQSIFLISTKNIDIPYNNIIRIVPEKGPLNTGKIELELSGLKERNVTLEFIDNVEQAVANISYVLQQYRNQQQLQNYRQAKIDATLNLV